MPHTIGTIGAHTSAATDPSTQSVTVLAGETVLVLMLKVRGSANRTGGSVTYGGVAMTQAGLTRKAPSSPEVSAELWYVVDPPVGTADISIPNTALQTMYWRAVAASAGAGWRSVWLANAGTQNTGTNPGVSFQSQGGSNIAFGVVATGATTWSPSAQTGTNIGNHDDGADGTGYQYRITTAVGTITMNYTFGTSDDWGLQVAVFTDDPPIALPSHLHVKAGDGFSVASERIR